jgi:signal transduction histidine kinase
MVPEESWERVSSAVLGLAMRFAHSGIVMSQGLPMTPLPLESFTWWLFAANPAVLLPLQQQLPQTAQVVWLGQEESLAPERFLILLSDRFAWLQMTTVDTLCFTLHPQPVLAAQQWLNRRVATESQVRLLSQHQQAFPPPPPPYEVMATLAGLWLDISIGQEVLVPDLSEADILRAMTHEVRTPLATIRTLIRSILRRLIDSELRQRLEQVDRECSQQIDRCNLIFAAVGGSPAGAIAPEPTAIHELLHSMAIPWQAEAAQRHLPFAFEMPVSLPLVFSNAALLRQILNNLMERILRGLPDQSQVILKVHPAGPYVKLQFHIRLGHSSSLPLQAIRSWLMLQPDTGTLSLSLPTTKSLLRSIGGHLTARSYADAQELITIFLPQVNYG